MLLESSYTLNALDPPATPAAQSPRGPALTSQGWTGYVGDPKTSFEMPFARWSLSFPSSILQRCVSLISHGPSKVAIKVKVRSWDVYWLSWANRFDFFTTFLLLVSSLLPYLPNSVGIPVQFQGFSVHEGVFTALFLLNILKPLNSIIVRLKRPSTFFSKPFAPAVDAFRPPALCQHPSAPAVAPGWRPVAPSPS